MSSSARQSPRGSATRSPFLSRSGSPVFIETGKPCLPCASPATAQDARRQLFIGAVVVFLALVLVSLSAVGFLVLRHEISHGVRVSATLGDNTTQTYRDWADNTFDPIVLTVYFYDLLNPDEVLAEGAKPSLREVGPFVYRDIKQKFAVEWKANRTLLSYQTLERFEFVRELSVADDTEEVLVPNLPFLGLQANFYGNPDSRPYFRQWYQNYTAKDTLFTRRSVRDVLFGYKDPVLEANFGEGFPGVLLNMSSPTQAYPADVIYSGVHAPPGQFRQLQTWRGEQVLRTCSFGVCANVSTNPLAWSTVEASSVGGSDGSQLPPGVDRGSSFDLFSEAALRRVRMQHTSDVTFKGIKCYRFQLDPREMLNATSEPANAVYHQGSADNPLPDGFFNVSGLAKNEALFVSRPHLLGVGEPAQSAVVVSYVADIEEEGFIDVEPITGSSMHLVQRSQLNFLIRPLPDMPVSPGTSNATFTLFPNLTATIVPVAWFQDEAAIDNHDARKLRTELYGAEELDHLALYLGVPLFTAVFFVGLWLLHTARKRLAEIEAAPLLPRDDLADEPPGELLDGTGVGLYGSTGVAGVAGAGAASAPVAVRPKARYASGPLTVSGSPRDITNTRSPPGPRSPNSSRARGGSLGGEVDISYA